MEEKINLATLTLLLLTRARAIFMPAHSGLEALSQKPLCNSTGERLVPVSLKATSIYCVFVMVRWPVLKWSQRAGDAQSTHNAQQPQLHNWKRCAHVQPRAEKEITHSDMYCIFHCPLQWNEKKKSCTWLYLNCTCSLDHVWYTDSSRHWTSLKCSMLWSFVLLYLGLWLSLFC